MQVLIDIPSEWITDLENGCFGAKYNAYDLAGAIMNGIVLQDSHGDLIDRDELKRYAGWYNLATDKSIHAVLTKEIDWVKPVIERTKEGENE
jgi:hypothetical protein